MTDKLNFKTEKKVTIKDISTMLHVSPMSVHRALTGKEGVSEALRSRIVLAAESMGYETNYAASSLKRKTCKIAAVLPNDAGIYYSYFWKGMETCIEKARGLNVELLGLICTDEEHQAILLKKIADSKENLAGLITFSYTRSPSVLLQLQRIADKGIMTVVLDDDLREPEGLYCIPPHEKQIACLAAEFISLITAEHDTVLLTKGCEGSKLHENKMRRFFECLAELKPGLQVHAVESCVSCADAYAEAERFYLEALQRYPRVTACYAMTSNANEPMVRAVAKAGMQKQVRIIGTDINTQTAKLLKDGRLTAVINQAPFRKAYAGLEILLDKIIRNVDPPLRVNCPFDIILRTNLGFFEGSENIFPWR